THDLSHSSYLSYFVLRDQTSSTPALNPMANVDQAVAAMLIRNTWELQSALEDTSALDRWETQKASGHEPLGGRRRLPGTQRGRRQIYTGATEAREKGQVGKYRCPDA